MSASRRAGHLLRAAAIAAVSTATLVVLMLAPSAPAAPVFTVIEPSDAPDANLADGVCASTNQGLCTLRAAVQQAEAVGGADIVLSQGLGAFSLTIPGGAEVDTAAPTPPNSAVGDLDISKPITITGQGPSESVIDGTNSVRVFDVHAGGGVLTLKGVRVQNGKGDYSRPSGHSHGGGIHNHGTVHLFNTVVDNNSSTVPNWGGGGITNAGGATATLENVTVSKNNTAHVGGGIENLGNLTMTNVTLADNSAPSAGGLALSGGTATLRNTLLAQNGAGSNCLRAAGQLATDGSNLDSDQSCGMGERFGDPGFETGQEGSGPLWYALGANSKAIDAGSPTTCPTTDVRGVARPKDGDGDGDARCDIGSYERERTATPNGGANKKPELSVAGVKLKEGDSGTKNARFTVTLKGDANGTVTVKAATSAGTATAPSDYKTKTATLTFKAGTTKKTFTVKVNGDTQREPDETFKVKLSSAKGATIADAKANGTIQNDD